MENKNHLRVGDGHLMKVFFQFPPCVGLQRTCYYVYGTLTPEEGRWSVVCVCVRLVQRVYILGGECVRGEMNGEFLSSSCYGHIIPTGNDHAATIKGAAGAARVSIKFVLQPNRIER